MDEPAIAFRGVSYRAQGRVLLGPLDLEVQRGETLVLLGRSGSGKTTALKLINRLLEESEGAVLVDGRPTREWDVIALRRRIGYVIQETGLFPHYTVERNVGLVPRLLGKPEREIRERVDSMLRLVDLDPQQFRHALPASAFGRPAAARGRGASAGRRSRNTAHGRAVRRARPAQPRGTAATVPGNPEATCGRPRCW